MLVQALYNIVDSVFVAKLSEEALTGVTLAFPMQNLMFAVAGGTGVGINAMLSKALGEKKQDEADSAAGNGIVLNLAAALIFMAASFMGAAGAFIGTQTSDPVIAREGTTYLSIVMILSIGMSAQVTMERLLQSTGRTFYTMITQALGAIINIIMDPIMIFGLFGFPKLGVAGAAYATIIGQSVAATLGLFFNITRNTDIRFSRNILRLKADTVKRIYFVGVPSILMIAIGSVMTYLFNLILNTFSSTAVAVFGAYFKLQSFFFMPVFGLNNGVIPVLAFNYGAKNKDRIREAMRFSILLAFLIMCMGTLVLELFPGKLLALFSASDDMMSLGITALRTIAWHFPIAGICIALGSVFQAFGRSFYSLIVSLGRQIFVLIPVAYALSLTGNVDNVWWAFLISEIMSFGLTTVFFRKTDRDIIHRLDKTE
ncbi:MAG: MATE family efflux transporter [Lachnospiraceae bacterium]|nr:MATE family efflux transporter [Lachnospiraceae bacterium]